MLILFDHGAPKGVSRALHGHIVITEEAGIDILFTTHQPIRYQENLSGRKIALVVFDWHHKVVARSIAS